MAEDLATNASRGGLIPTWFLAVYVMVTLLVPLTHAFWLRAGLVPVAALVAALGVALLFDGLGLRIPPGTGARGSAGWPRW